MQMMSITPSELLAMDDLEQKFAIVCALEHEKWANAFME
jgi:hypothetical protein